MAALSVHKKQALKLVVACYFLLISITPLAYALSGKQAPERIYAAVKTSPAVTSAGPSAKASLSDSQSSAETAPHASRNSRVPIKQKKAVTPEDFSEKIALFTVELVPASCFCDPLASAVRCLPEKRPEINKGFNPLFAGNSPPSV